MSNREREGKRGVRFTATMDCPLMKHKKKKKKPNPAGKRKDREPGGIKGSGHEEDWGGGGGGGRTSLYEDPSSRSAQSSVKEVKFVYLLGNVRFEHLGMNN